MELIDLAKFVKTGEGANGSSYDSLEDPNLIVKLYNPVYDLSAILAEQEVARKVWSLGIPSPEPGEAVTDGERTGIRFRRIVGKRSFSRMLADEPGRTEEFARQFARECRKLHGVQCPAGMFPSVKDVVLNLLAADKAFDAREKEVIASFVKSVPDSLCAIHGDMHIGNLLSTLPFGKPLDTPHELYFIDLGYFCCGNPLFDLGMLYFVCILDNEDFRYENFHIHAEQTAEVWKFFVDEYFEGRYTVAEAEKLIGPYTVFQSFLIEHNMGSMPPVFEEHLRKVFGL